MTETLPPIPDPNVLLTIVASLTIERAPALTVTAPAFPVLPALACEEIPVIERGSAPLPSMITPPATRTETLPASAAPKVLARTEPLVRTVSAPGPLPVTSTDTVPPSPIRAVPRLMLQKPDL